MYKVIEKLCNILECYNSHMHAIELKNMPVIYMLLISSYKSYCSVYLNVHFWSYTILRNFEIYTFLSVERSELDRNYAPSVCDWLYST